MPMEIDIKRIALDFSNRTLAFILSLIASNTPDILSSNPCIDTKGPVKFSKAFANLKSVIIVPAPIPTANTAPKSIFFNTSISFDPISFTKSNTDESPSFNPLKRPCIMFLPISKNSVDGECIPRTLHIPSMILRPSSIIAETTSLPPETKPFTRP